MKLNLMYSSTRSFFFLVQNNSYYIKIVFHSHASLEKYYDMRDLSGSFHFFLLRLEDRFTSDFKFNLLVRG